MTQATGSVYLDAPARARHRPPVPRVNRTRSFLAGMCVVVGLIALSLSAVVAGLRVLVLDGELVVDAFDAALDNPQAQADLERQIAAAIEEGLVGEELSAVAAVFELDVEAEAARIAPLILAEPTVRDELRTLVIDLHARVVLEPDPSVIDLAPLTTAVLTVIERESPRLATIVPSDSTLWTVDSDTLPDLTRAADLFDRGLTLALLPVLLLPLAAALHPRRHKVVGWIGRWALSLGVVSVLAAIGLPYLAGTLTGWQSVEIAIRSNSLRLLAPAGLAAILGIGFVALAAVAHRREQRKVIEEGAAAALGTHEPPAWQSAVSPTLDLAARGLVDVNHPLTSV